MKFYKKASSTNLTLILPVACNASCDFCFWQKQERIDKEQWLNTLKKTLESVGDKIGSISISGGEPTIDVAFLKKVLIIINTYKTSDLKLVLNTNGFGLPELIKSNLFCNTVDIINLSRHKIKDEDNDAVIQTKGLTKEKIIELINYLENETKITVSINKVVTKETNYEELVDFIDFTKEVKANNLVFRQLVTKELEPANNLDLQLCYNKKVVVNSCPVCRTREYTKYGTHIIFKYGVIDTYDYFADKDTIYEFIFNEKGILAYDWAGKTNYLLKVKKEELKEKLEKESNFRYVLTDGAPTITGSISSIRQPIQNYSFGCGSSGC